MKVDYLIPDCLRNYLRWIRSQWRHRGVYVPQSSIVDRDCVFDRPCVIGPNVRAYGSRVGRYSYLAYGVTLTSCSVGNFCSLGPSCAIGGGLHPTRDWVSTSPVFYSTQCQAGKTFASDQLFEERSTTELGHDVWVGWGAIVLPGVRVGHGAVIAAGAVVSREVHPFEVVAGVPARHLRTRFSPTQIAELLKLQWWDKDERWLRSKAPYFQNITEFLEHAYA